MLIASPRHTSADLRLWRELEAADLVHGRRLVRDGRKVARSLEALAAFTDAGPCYLGVSWGKDSVVVAHLARRVPLVWVRVEPWTNPDCLLVRDAYLAAHPVEVYREEVVTTWRDREGGTSAHGFAAAQRALGTDRHVSGVRADESRSRLLRCARWGESTPRTCAPLARWTAQDVYGYLAHHGLPVHPAYACLGGGRWPRDRIRVASLGGQRGDGLGRAEWEREYYGDALRIASAAAPAPSA